MQSDRSSQQENSTLTNEKLLGNSIDENNLTNQIDAINEEAIQFIENNDSSNAIALLSKAEKMLDFLANCGKPLDRNLIIVVLYNEASVYQSIWELEKCKKFMDGVIFNLKILVAEENKTIEQRLLKIKRLSFLSKVYLQYCAVLSQLGRHEQSLEIARQTVKTLTEMFRLSALICSISLQQQDQSQTKKTKFQNTPDGQMVIEEVEFKQEVLLGASKFLKCIINSPQFGESELTDERTSLAVAARQVYFWRNNPENNEKHLREQLNVPIQSDDQRSLLGVQNEFEWVEQFNIGTIMHISPVQYTQFALSGELLYEFSKKILLEKILYLSIAYFTMATEMRFVEIDRNKTNPKSESYQQSPLFKKSLLYHLKAVEIACRHVQCTSPYIDHLISSFHKHYNQNLEPILEEASFTSQMDERTVKGNPVNKNQKSLSDHSTKKREFQTDIEFLARALRQKSPNTNLGQRSKPQSVSSSRDTAFSNLKKDDEDFILQQKKLSLESLKLVLTQLQQKVVKGTMKSNPEQNNLSHQLSGTIKPMDPAKNKKKQETENDRDKLKGMTLAQLKKLQAELEIKNNKQGSHWNKSLNNLLSINQRKRPSEAEQICKTERSAEENRKISKSYAYLYPRSPQTNSSKMTSFQFSQIVSQSNQNETKEVENTILKRTPLKPQKKSPIAIQYIISSNTLNISNGQNFIIQHSNDNKTQKSKSNHNQQQTQTKYFKKPAKHGISNEQFKSLHVNLKMETLQALLKNSTKNQKNF